MILAGILIAVYLLIAYFPTPEGLTPTAQKAIGVMVSAVLSAELSAVVSAGAEVSPPQRSFATTYQAATEARYM